MEPLHDKLHDQLLHQVEYPEPHARVPVAAMTKAFMATLHGAGQVADEMD